MSAANQKAVCGTCYKNPCECGLPQLPSELSPAPLLADAAATVEWALGIIEMYDRRLVQLGDPPHLVYSETHKDGIWKAREVLIRLKLNSEKPHWIDPKKAWGTSEHNDGGCP